jgi:hypothetical protein
MSIPVIRRLPQPPRCRLCFDEQHRPDVIFKQHSQTVEADSQDQRVTTVVAQASAEVHGGIHHHQGGPLDAVDLVRAGDPGALPPTRSHRRAVQAVGPPRVGGYIEHPVPRSG